MIQNLCKTVLEKGGIVQHILIDAKDSEGLGLTNPSVFYDNGDLIVNLRHVQYSLYHSEGKQLHQNQWGPLTYIHPEDDLTLRTTNYLCYINPETLELKEYNKVDTTKLDVTPIWEFIGLEDARIARWDNKLYLCGVRRDTTTNGVGRMELSEIINNQEVNRYRIEPPNGYSYCEKNWMPVLDMPYHFVKWCSTTEVVEVDIHTGTSKTVVLKEQSIKFPRDLRGGSQVISYGNYRIAITHEVDLWHNEQNRKDAHYYHRIIVWDKDWNIVAHSDYFKFMTARIEFSCGLAFDGKSFIVTFGFQDTTAYIMRIPEYAFLDLVGLSCDVDRYENLTPKLIKNFIKDPYNDVTSVNLAEFFYQKEQYASAISYYLRTAEYSTDKNLIYDSLIKLGRCLHAQGRRLHSELHSYLNAVKVNPDRPEAYYFLSQAYNDKDDTGLAYTFACLGADKTPENILNIEYPGSIGIVFQKALNAWHTGRFEESEILFKDLSENYPLIEPFRSEIFSSLKYFEDKTNKDLIPKKVKFSTEKKHYKVVDFFPYFDETGRELLQLRYHLLKDHVDLFVICESSRTQSGRPIEFNLKNYIAELGLPFEKFMVIELTIADSDTLVIEDIDHANCYEGNSKNIKSLEARARERQQKDSLMHVLNRFEENTVFIVGDSDEMVNPKHLDYILKMVKANPSLIIKIPLVHLEGKANLRVYNKETGLPKSWDGGLFVCTKSQLAKASPTRIRSNVNNPFEIGYITENGVKVEDLGWHFSWMGDKLKRQIKKESFTHYDDTLSFLEHSSYKDTPIYDLVEGSIPPSGETHMVLKHYPESNLPSVLYDLPLVKDYLLGETPVNFFDVEYQKACLTPSDINENLPILYNLAKECMHVTEMGVRTGVSTRAFLNTDVILRSYDIDLDPDVEALFSKAKTFDKDVEYIKADVRDITIDQTDLLFIDTWHCYEQLKTELRLHHSRVNKYIAFHDTQTYGVSGEEWYEYKGEPLIGLLPAIIEFIIEHPEWKFHTHKINNNGLTVLVKKV